MKNKPLALTTLISLFLLGCAVPAMPLNPQNNEINEETEQKEEDSGGNSETQEEEHHEDEGNQGQEEEHHEDDEGGGGNQGEHDHDEDPPITPTYKYSLEDYTTFKFYDEDNYPAYHDDWVYYYGTSKNPNGQLYGSPDKPIATGISFDKSKQYMTSPTFKTWEKVEVRLILWFSSHESTKYKSTDNEPQLKIEQYNSDDTLLATENIFIEKSDIPTNNTNLKKTLYLYQNTMSYFVIKYNNTVANKDSGYTMVLHETTLKGWPYGRD